MANLFIAKKSNNLFVQSIRWLSSFNNNRTKFGIVSILKNEDFNIWSDSNWSELNKQFNKSAEFPLPGQVGVAWQSAAPQPIPEVKEKKPVTSALLDENIDFILKRPLSQDFQALKLKEAAGGLYYKSKIDNCLFNLTVNKGMMFELNLLKCPVSLAKDFQTYFKSNLINESSVNILTVSFKTENDMATWSSQVEEEREVLVKNFVETSREICSLLEKAGYWADFIDPSSGRPAKSSYSHATFYETDERYRQLGFEVEDYGCCKVISHHTWGTKTYVGSVLTNAPADSEFLQHLLKRYNQ